MFKNVFSSLITWGTIIYLFSLSECYILRIDSADSDFETNNFHFDHLESRKFYETEEELIGVWQISQNPPPIGVWVFESLGEGGCCGGLWEVRTPYFNATETIELLVRYVSNVNLEVNAFYKGSSTTIRPDERIILPPNNSTVINWRTEMFTIQNTRFIRLASRHEFIKRGYLLMDKLIVAVNEPIPVEYYR